MDILVVRHGQSVADIEQRHEGRADFELTELGVRQAEAAAAWIAENYKLDRIYSSTLKRAAKTASLIGKATGTEIMFDQALMEWDNGLLAGLTREEAAVRFPLPAGGRKPHDELADAESMIQFRARAEMFWSRLLDSNEENARVCIVSHGGMIDMLFRCFLQLPMVTGSSMATGDTGMHLWRIHGNSRVIMFSNKQEHLCEMDKH